MNIGRDLVEQRRVVQLEDVPVPRLREPFRLRTDILEERLAVGVVQRRPLHQVADLMEDGRDRIPLRLRTNKDDRGVRTLLDEGVHIRVLFEDDQALPEWPEDDGEGFVVPSGEFALESRAVRQGRRRDDTEREFVPGDEPAAVVKPGGFSEDADEGSLVSGMDSLRIGLGAEMALEGGLKLIRLIERTDLGRLQGSRDRRGDVNKSRCLRDGLVDRSAGEDINWDLNGRPERGKTCARGFQFLLQEGRDAEADGFQVGNPIAHLLDDLRRLLVLLREIENPRNGRDGLDDCRLGERRSAWYIFFLVWLLLRERHRSGHGRRRRAHGTGDAADGPAHNPA